MSRNNSPSDSANDSPNESADADLATKPRAETKRPQMYKVILLNDDYTPMEFVVFVLEQFFKISNTQAYQLMLIVHKKGLAVVGVFSRDVAETKITQVMAAAKKYQHPLQCIMEKD